jgi:hypothetical protein
VIAGPGLRLSTATLYSSDGGASWSTAGTSQLALDDKRRGQRGSFSADLMSFNVKDQTLLARGHLSGALAQAGQDPVAISAGELRADLQRNRVTIGGGLRLSMGGLTLSTAAAAAPVALDLASKEVRLDGGFTLSDSAQGLDLQGSGLTGSLGAGKQVNVGGGVRLSDAGRGLLLTADRLAAVLEPLKLTASGRVHLEYGKSSYEAQQAVVTRQGSGKSAKYVVEMAGPQKGRIDLDELQQKQAAAAAGKD